MLGFLQNWAQNDHLVKSKLVCWQIFTSLQIYYPKIRDLPEKKSKMVEKKNLLKEVFNFEKLDFKSGLGFLI